VTTADSDLTPVHPRTSARETRSGAWVVEVALLDRNGVIVAVNQAWDDFALDNGGDPITCGVGASYLHACAAGDDQPSRDVAAAIRSAVRGELPTPMTVPIACHAPDQERWFDVLISPRSELDGRLAGATVTISPARPLPGRVTLIDERTRRELRSTGRTGLEMLPDPVIVHDAGLRIEYANPAAARLLGVRPHELIGERLTFAGPAPDGEGYLDHVRALISDDGGSGTPDRPDHVIHQDVLSYGSGSELPCEAHVRMLDDLELRGLDLRGLDLPGSDVPGSDMPGPEMPGPEMHLSGVRDIATGGTAVEGDRTSRGPHFVVVLRELGHRTARRNVLQVSERSFRSAFQHAPIGMAVARLDTGGGRRIVQANRTFADMFRVEPEALRDRDFAEFSLPDDEAVERAVASRMAAGLQRDHARRKQYRRADGSTLWAELRASMVDFPDVPGPTALVYLVDVTQRHQATQELARQARLKALIAEITTAVLTGTPLRDTYGRIVRGAVRVVDADDAVLILEDTLTGLFEPVAVVGSAIAGVLADDLQLYQERVAALLDRDHILLPERPRSSAADGDALTGPAMIVRFEAGAHRRGLLLLSRRPGRASFSPTELDVVTSLTRQTTLVVEVESAQEDRRRLAVLEERDRIARDLHDTVIQDLIAVGMQLARRLEREPDPDRTPQDRDLLEQIEAAERRLRGAVSELHLPPFGGHRLADAVPALVAEAARTLGHQPTVELTGTQHELPDTVRDELVVVLREALSNVARHAGAHATRIEIVLEEGRAWMVVEDDGRGIPRHASTGTGSGIPNMRHRAEALGGTATLTDRAGGGTRLTWTCYWP
jgi:PAS domain S-box-containing protein